MSPKGALIFQFILLLEVLVQEGISLGMHGSFKCSRTIYSDTSYYRIYCLTNITIYINVTLNSEPECPDSCPQNYEPVCGTDHETYPNECELKVHACYTKDEDLKVKHDGECKGKIFSAEKKNSFACYDHLDLQISCLIFT